MSIITRQELQGSGKYWSWINHEGLNTFIVETDTQLSEDDAIILKNKYLDDHLYDALSQVIVSIYENKEIIVAAVTFIKTTNPSLSQWNNYLAGISWNDALAVRWFLAILANKLADNREITLSSYTETQVLNSLKTFFINTSARRLTKILFGE